MSASNDRVQNVEDIDIENMDHANTAVIDNSTDADSKETILRRLKKALRLAAKLQTKLEVRK
jgi:demethoxyubiquinone hydroxylase (CLK1/Coq7/Cat5 family)